MNDELARSLIKPQVKEYLDKNWIGCYVPYDIYFNPEFVDHVLNIGTTIMMNKIGINTQPGSFIKSILNNDLAGSVGHADHINIKVIPFYSTMLYNLSIEFNTEFSNNIKKS